MNLLLIGNPNVGKTSLFNQLTGLRARVGNYPGITVERRYAEIQVQFEGERKKISLADSPGTYSLVARSPEEQITIDAVLGLGGLSRPDVVIAVVNATQLSRNLYLVLQLLELRVPTVIALNMMDEAGENAPTAETLSQVLGVPVVATNGDTGQGGSELLQAALALSKQSTPQRSHLKAHYDERLIPAIDRVADALPDTLRSNVERDRALALWALMSLDDEDELVHIPSQLRERVQAVVRDYAREGDTVSTQDDPGTLMDRAIISARYRAIDEALTALGKVGEAPILKLSDRIDRVILHPVFGMVSFCLAMLLIFQSLFSWSDPAISLIEEGVAALQGLAMAHLPAGILSDLLIEGVLGGVGNVVVFLPQILLLFFFIGILEDSGYMARVAYLMDRIMRSLGLHGRAFVPMLSGFACAIPAILATRTLERRRDRLLTMMVVPLMTCSARLPVYTLIIAALFPVSDDSVLPTQGLLMVALYLFSVVTALVAAFVLGRTVIRGKSIPLILELPPYRIPRLKPTLSMMRVRASQFLNEAGTVILAATIVLWTLLSFPRQDVDTAPLADTPTANAEVEREKSDAPDLEHSYAGRMGKALEPVMEPLGFDWKITTAIIGAFAAREVFISTLGLVFGMGDLDDEALPLRQRIQQEKKQDGSRAYTPLMGLSLMVFFALACQCMSTLAVVKRETASYRWPAFLFVYMTGLAYLASLLIFQVGRLLGY